MERIYDSFKQVTLVLNGQAISSTQKSIKALIDPATQALLDAQNTALAAMQTAETNEQVRIFYFFISCDHG